jgi:hypothetical protein
VRALHTGWVERNAPGIGLVVERKDIDQMKPATLRALAIGLVAIPTAAYVASTSTDCGAEYVSFLERVSRPGTAMSGDQLAALHRGSLRIFGACNSGHLPDAHTKFVELEGRVGTPTDLN